MVRDSAPWKATAMSKIAGGVTLDDDDLEGKDQARVTGEVLGGMTNLDVDDEEHQMEEQPLEKRWLENAHPNVTLQELG